VTTTVFGAQSRKREREHHVSQSSEGFFMALLNPQNVRWLDAAEVT
jgi:hypothetical protein